MTDCGRALIVLCGLVGLTIIRAAPHGLQDYPLQDNSLNEGDVDLGKLEEDVNSPAYIKGLEEYIESNLKDAPWMYADDVDSSDFDMDQDKRGAPSPYAFYGARGRRADGYGSSVREMMPTRYYDNEQPSDTLKLRQELFDTLSYFKKLRALRTKKIPTTMHKRKPPSGFHAVRGKRSLQQTAESTS